MKKLKAAVALTFAVVGGAVAVSAFATTAAAACTGPSCYEVTMEFIFGGASYSIEYRPTPPAAQRFIRLNPTATRGQYGGAYAAPNGYKFCNLTVLTEGPQDGTFHISWQNNMKQFAYYAGIKHVGDEAGGMITFTLYPSNQMPTQGCTKCDKVQCTVI